MLGFMLLNTFFLVLLLFNCFCKGLALCCWKPVSCYDPGSSQASSCCTFPSLEPALPPVKFYAFEHFFFGAPAEFNCFCKGLALCCWKPVSCYDPGSSQASSFCTFPSLEPALPSCSVVCVWTLFGPCCFNSLFQKVWHFADGNQWAAMTQAAPRLLLFVLSPALNLPFPNVKFYAFEHFFFGAPAV